METFEKENSIADLFKPEEVVLLDDKTKALYDELKQLDTYLETGSSDYDK